MDSDRNQVLTVFLREIAECARHKDKSRCHKLLDRVQVWGQEVASASPDARTCRELKELRHKLTVVGDAYTVTARAYKDLLASFERFRISIEILHHIRRLDDVPEALARIKTLHSMPLLHLVLDQDIFGLNLPTNCAHASPGQLRESMGQFMPAPHWPLLYLGDVGAVKGPSFFWGQEVVDGSCFIFALRHKHQEKISIGFLAAYDPNPHRYGADKATDFLGHFCDVLACTLINVLEHMQLAELVVRDPLTKINNRAYLERHAPRILEFAARRDFPVHLCFIDLNGFKAVNDALGHEAGDRVLIAVAQTIQAMVRSYDICVRLGGDEFVVLLPDADAAKAQLFCSRLHQALAKIDVAQISGQPTSLRISAAVGLATHACGQSLEDLLREADQLMYAVKPALDCGF